MTGVVKDKSDLRDIEKFYSTYFQKVAWVEKLRSYDYTNFLRSYLIPPALINVAKNEISVFHALVLLLAKRSLKDKKKVVVFNPEHRDMVFRLIYLAWRYLKFLRNKKAVFEELKKKRVVVSWRDFANLVQSSLIYWEKDMEEFEDIEELLFRVLRLYKVSLKEDESVEGIKIEVFIKKGDYKHEKKGVPPL